jgi:site-specific recombinase XerD
MGASFNPIFNRKKTANKSGKYTISIRVTVDRKSSFINPQLPKIEEKHWSGKPNKWVKDSYPNHYLFNKTIGDKLSELNEFSDRLQLMNRAITLNKVIEFYDRRGDRSNFNDYVEEYIRTYKFQSVLTRQKYKTFESLLKEFNPNIRFSNLEEVLFLDFRDFLINKKKQRGTTVEKYFDPFKKIVKDAVRRDYLPKNPFTSVELKIVKQRSLRVSLSQEEIQSLLNLSFTQNEQHLEPHRDVFIFQCFTGLYYNDIKILQENSFVTKKEKLFLVGDRFKTEEPYFIPLFLFPEAERVLNKYKSVSTEIFPTITEPAYNRSLKVIAEKAGIKKSLTNKVGRHTFGDLLASQGYSDIQFKKMFGLTKNSQASKHYFDLSIDRFLEGLS